MQTEKFLKVIFLIITALCLTTRSSFIQTQTGKLQNFNGYATVQLLHFDVPLDSSEVLFQLLAVYGEKSYCSNQTVNVVIKYGSPAVMNPDNSSYPFGFFYSNRPNSYYTKLSSNLQTVNIPFINPFPGKYFLSAFLPALDLRNEENDIPEECYQFLNVTFSSIIKPLRTIIENEKITNLQTNESSYYKLFIPSSVDHVLLEIKNESFCNNCDKLIIIINQISVNSSQTVLIPFDVLRNNTFVRLWTQENSWYYIQFQFSSNSSQFINGSLSFVMKYIDAIIFNTTSSDSFAMKSRRLYRHNLLSSRIFYDEYVTVMQKNPSTFSYFYHLGSQFDPFIVNITFEDFVSIIFEVPSQQDVGGTIKVEINLVNASHLSDAYQNIRVLTCISRETRQVLIWPSNCTNWYETTASPLVLNASTISSYFYLPYPEPGLWFLTFRLFGNSCPMCNCSDSCERLYENCTNTCEQLCEYRNICSQCTEDCRWSILSEIGCDGCYCSGGCSTVSETWSTAMQVEIESSMCLEGSCGVQGSCGLYLSQGFAYSTCVCRNNYIGWDCSDDTYANSFILVLLEYLLLTLSNVGFIPSAIIAFRRTYYVPCVMYFSVFVMSSVYHMCDAGESILTYCILPFGVLQFADFFCAMVALWTTLVSIGYVSSTTESVCYIIGTVVLAIGVRLNMMSVWLYIVFGLSSSFLVLCSWGYLYQIKRIYPRKRYLLLNIPLGLALLTVGLMFFGLSNNRTYKYFHSLWHILMALAVFIVLPKKNYFLQPR